MKINVNIDLFLSDEELSFFKKEFYGDSLRKHNPFFLKNRNDIIHIIDSTIQKGIIQSDNLGNISLTVLGKALLSELDRNNRIDRIISD